MTWDAAARCTFATSPITCWRYARFHLLRNSGVEAPPISARGGALMHSDYTALDEALAILEPYGPEYHGGFANHGPMAVEALCALGRADAVLPWVDNYRKALEPRPLPRERISGQAWREVLGRESRVADWTAFFENEIEERPWQQVLSTWVPRLASGLIAAAAHGP